MNPFKTIRRLEHQVSLLEKKYDKECSDIYNRLAELETKPLKYEVGYVAGDLVVLDSYRITDRWSSYGGIAYHQPKLPVYRTQNLKSGQCNVMTEPEIDRYIKEFDIIKKAKGNETI